MTGEDSYACTLLHAQESPFCFTANNYRERSLMVLKWVSILSISAVLPQPSPSIISVSGLNIVVATVNLKESKEIFALLFKIKQLSRVDTIHDDLTD